jgi:hypothetical protein
MARSTLRSKLVFSKIRKDKKLQFLAQDGRVFPELTNRDLYVSSLLVTDCPFRHRFIPTGKPQVVSRPPEVRFWRN